MRTIAKHGYIQIRAALRAGVGELYPTAAAKGSVNPACVSQANTEKQYCLGESAKKCDSKWLSTYKACAGR